MENTDKKGMFARIRDWYNAEDVAAQFREGSVNSYGGDSPLSGVVPEWPANSVEKVSADQALGIAAVYRSVSIISGHVAQLDLGVWRYGQEIDLVAANNNAIIRQPSFDESRSAILEETAVSLATAGNAYWRLLGVKQAGDYPVAIEVLNPHLMVIEYDKNGNKTYRYYGYRSERVFKEYEVKHLKLLRVPGSQYGLGPIQAAQAEMRGSLELRDYSSAIFSDNVTPSGVLKTDQVLTAEQANAYRQRYLEQMSGKKGVLVVGQGISYTPVYLNPVDAQFLENQQFSITQVARMFGVPASKLLAEVNGNSMTYTNMESANIDYVRDTLTPYLREIEEAFSSLIPRGQNVSFKVEGLLRADTKTRYDAYSVALSAGFLTLNEVRAKEGLPPIPGGNEITTKVGDSGTQGTSATA